MGTALGGIPGARIEERASLARLSTFRIGGSAEVLAEVATEDALAEVLARLRERRIPVQLVGLGSNVLFPDEGLPGAVLRLAGRFLEIRFDGDRVEAGAGVALPKLARRSAASGLSGLEPLCGFPSTVGGAVVMNAGCYGTEIRDVMLDCRVLDEDGAVRELATDELEPGYRSTNLQGTRAIVLSARFGLEPAESEACLARIEELNERRWASLPSGLPNVGSIFRNPKDDYAGRLIEACGLKGRRQGGAQISPKHANVIVNHGEATAADVVALMAAAAAAVRARFGVELEPEVILTGALRRLWLDARAVTNSTAKIEPPG